MSKLARLFVLSVLLVFVAGWGKDVYAVACTSAASGNWSLQTTWGAAGTGCAGAVGGIPGAADTVTIAAAHTVTVDADSAAASIAVAAPSGATNGVTLAAGVTLNVGGAITMAAPGTNLRTSTFAVGSGALTAASISINGGTITKVSQMTVSTGTITTTGNIAFAGTAANARFVSTGASTVNVGGNFGSGGTLTTGGTGTINFNGGAAQTIGAYATYNNIAINNTAGGVALAGNATIGGTLSVNTGTLTVGAFTLAVTGATTVNSAISITSTTGTKTFTGNVTINSGGTLSETVAELITYGGDVTINNGGTLTEFGAATMACAGNLQNDGTYTASTGVHTFSGAARTFGGANPVVIPRVTVSGTYQNNGTLTVATALAGAGGLTNGATGTLNIGGTSAITTLTATAAGNIVNYTGAAAQTVKATTYDTLGFSGAGVKTNSGVVTVNTDLTGTALTNAAAGTLNIGGASTITTLTATAAGNTVNYTGTGQTINATSYSNLNVTGTATNSGTVTVATALGGAGALTNDATGTLNIGFAAAPTITTLTATAVGNTVNYNRAGAQTVKATTYHHLQFSGSGAKTAAAGLAVNGDLTLSGSATFAAGAFTHDFAGNWIVNTTAAAPLSVATTSAINFNTPAIPAPTSVGGTTAATLAFADVNINNTSGVIFNDNASFSAGTTPTLAVAAGATLTPAAAVIFSGTGTLTGSGTVQVTRITAGTANFASQYTIATKTLTDLTVEYIGAAAQTVSVLTYGSATGGGLKVNNASGVSLTADTTVAGTLTLENGVVNAGAFTLIGSGDCTTKVARTGGHVAGLLQLAFPAGAPSCTFHVGDAAGYRPIDVSFASVTVAGSLAGGVSQAAGEHPDIATSTLDSTKDVNRYWALTNPVGGTIAYTTYTATFNFINPGDIDGGAIPANFEIERWDGAVWNVTTLGSATATSTSASGLPAIAAGSSNSFAVGEKVQPVVVSINRADADPTNAASVSWTVTFNRNVTGVNSSNFALANIGLGGAPAITNVSGGGKIWSVTASTGTGSGTLGLNMTNSTGVSPAITGLPFTGQVYTLDRTAPVVSSIVRANPTPTSQASVSWTVTFSESVTGVDTTDFALVQGGGVSGAAIISAIGGGTSWTVTASTGVGQGTLGLNLVDDDTIVDTASNPLGGTGAGNGNFSGEFYDIVSAATVTASPTVCTNVAGIGTQVWGTLTGPLANDNIVYATASVDGTITNFLQCTGYGFAIPAGATINGITVNVDRKSSSAANGGSRDAAMRLVKDVAGVATIQATDRSTATIYTTADVTEAHGGAADLWGAAWAAADINHANFGAAFAATKASAAGGAHTVSVDHIQIGVSYTALPDHYELHLPTSGIACLPVTVTVKACADNSSPCTSLYATASGTVATLATDAGALGSTTVIFDATGVASTTLSYPAAADGAAASVTLSGEQVAATNSRKCCPDGVSCAVANSCSATFNTAGFILSGAADGAAATIPTQVAGTSSGTFYLRAVKTNTTTKACETALAGASVVNFAYECNNPATCYAANLMSVNGGAATTIARNNNGSVTSYLPVSMTFDANGNAPFTFNYSDVGQVTLHALKAAGGALLSALAGSSNAFVVKPGGFVLSAIQQTAAPNTPNPAAADATGAKFVKAGEAFTATVTATTVDGVTATPNYGQEAAPESVKLASALAAGLGLTNNPAIGGTFGAFTNGAATGTAFTWNEAGIITLTPSVADADYLGAGDVAGTTTGNVGRFYAAQFALSGGIIANRTALSGCASPAGCDTFTYMGEQMSAVFNLTAKAVDGTTTLQNYNYSATAANNFAKLDPTATGNPLALGAVDTGTPRTVATLDTATYGAASGSFAGGIASVTAPFAVTRGASTSGPFDALEVGVAPVDGDGAVLAVLDLAVNAGGTPDTHGKIGSTKARYGRMKISSAHGSELLKLPIPMEVQYWQGQYWVQNGLDDATTIVQNNVKLATISGPAVTISSITKDAAGKWRVILNKPLVAASSSVCLDLDTGATGDTSCQAAMPLSMPYLQTGAAFDKDPVSRATFGVYKGNDDFIYLREAY